MRARTLPHLLFIMTDQQRKDSLGCYGGTSAATPHLDRLASSSAAFDHFYVNNPVCVPSRCSFLTGRYPSAHRSRDLERPLDPGEPHLFRLLQEAGYRLALAGKNHALPKEELALFDHRLERGHRKASVPSATGVYGSGRDPGSLEQYSTVQLCEDAKAYMRQAAAEQPEQPFCLWLSIPDPHTPIQVPEPYDTIVNRQQLPPRVEPMLDKSKPNSQQLLQRLQGVAAAEPALIDEYRAIYYGMVALIDEQVGSVLDELEQLGLSEQTIIVYTSDHGEYLGDHGMVRKSWNFYDCLMNVPFMLQWKGKLKPARITDTMAESVDLLPTLLELIGLLPPEGVQGRSFAALLRGETDVHKDKVYAEAGHPGQLPPASTIEEWQTLEKPGPYWMISAMQGCMVRTLDWKLCRYANGESELYDLAADPGETVNLYAEPSARSAKLTMLELMTDTLMAVQDPRYSSARPFGKHG
ncbi:sulfatase [Paenibacillus sp. 1P07SE]|uniref:sulfatase family protein n=1 Tax=Paenibacillus sp. 1P07SE TaxID=3132209 RepID=UPI0039A61E50